LHLDIRFENILVYGDNINIIPVITNFENSIKITTDNYEYDWETSGKNIIGRDSEFTAPEVRDQIDSSVNKINYSKQPSFTFGILCKKLFSDYPFDEIDIDRSEDHKKINRAKLDDLREKIEKLILINPKDRILIEDALPAFDILGYEPVEEINL